MEGSWAGAMGHTQFIPTTYLEYAVDFTGDGTRDIWRAISDALASTANFLKEKGWNSGETWGYEVVLPNGFDYGLADGRTQRTLAEWAKLGIERPGGRPFPRPSDPARLIVPAGASGPAFLMINNFYVIKRYNNATAYALAVGHLADRLMGFGPIQQSWPTDEQPLARSERKELQQLLADMGFLRGKIDGIIGPQTQAAVRDFQRSVDLVPDGFATKRLLEKIRAAQAG
jgi:membrane-bound lytic murein transglycosylase B